jgi:SAM-dependent methyltransferase
VIEEISPHDGMWEGDREEYFEIAASGLECVRKGLRAARRDSAQRILDFGCGHGRVMRALRDDFPDAELTACDLDEDGVRFCAERFAALGVVSRPEIPLISLPRGYDAIWCGSVLTHLAAPQWKQLLDRFAEWLAPGGVLVFTTHGRSTVATLRARHWSYGLADAEIDAVLAKYDHAGFGYIAYPGQANYGFSLCTPAWVQGFLETFDALELLTFEDKGWTGHQDVFAVKGCRTT